ncbi:MAG: hypothetical protein LBI29_03935 [Rickettsiales bacterium]|jgi:hypothetical protein|nr:hypothetical protein [Rickettsiales bacterium]
MYKKAPEWFSIQPGSMTEYLTQKKKGREKKTLEQSRDLEYGFFPRPTMPGKHMQATKREETLETIRKMGWTLVKSPNITDSNPYEYECRGTIKIKGVPWGKDFCKKNRIFDLSSFLGAPSKDETAEYEGNFFWSAADGSIRPKSHEQVRIRCKDGSSYAGCLDENYKMSGLAVFKSSLYGSYYYEGRLIRGKPEGEGARMKKELNDGSTYEGGCKNGKMYGLGKIVHPDGSVYEGKFVGNKIQGKGKATFLGGYAANVFFQDGKLTMFSSLKYRCTVLKGRTLRSFKNLTRRLQYLVMRLVRKDAENMSLGVTDNKPGHHF